MESSGSLFLTKQSSSVQTMVRLYTLWIRVGRRRLHCLNDIVLDVNAPYLQGMQTSSTSVESILKRCESIDVLAGLDEHRSAKGRSSVEMEHILGLLTCSGKVVGAIQPSAILPPPASVGH